MKGGLPLAIVWPPILGIIWAAANVDFPLFSAPSARAHDVSQTAQLTPTSPELERRDQAVSGDDLRILLRATERRR
jgi:hypothetical protein